MSVLIVYGSYLASFVIAAPEKTMNPQAQSEYLLGMQYATGQNVGWDMNKALGMITRSAEQGYGEAQYMLGNAYYQGVIGQNYSKAYVWFSLAADNGYAKAGAIRYEIGGFLSPAELTAARKEIANRMGK